MKNIKIDLLPEDFVGTSYVSNCNCALAKSYKRNFGSSVCVKPTDIEDLNGRIIFKIKDRFNADDYYFVKQQYDNPKCNKIYQVTLIKV